MHAKLPLTHVFYIQKSERRNTTDIDQDTVMHNFYVIMYTNDRLRLAFIPLMVVSAPIALFIFLPFIYIHLINLHVHIAHFAHSTRFSHRSRKSPRQRVYRHYSNRLR